MRDTPTEAGPQSKRGRRMPRQSIITRASPSRVKRRTGRGSSPAIWLEIFPAAPLTFDSFSNSKGTRLRRWKSSHRRWSARLVGCVERRGGLRFNHLLPGNQHDSEASFVSHHASVSFGSIGQRNGFDQRTDLLQGAKGKRVLGIYRRSGHRSRNRTHTEKKRDRIDANVVMAQRIALSSPLGCATRT